MTPFGVIRGNHASLKRGPLLIFKARLVVMTGSDDPNRLQTAGLRHFEDMKTRIPHEEGLQITAHVRSTSAQLFDWSLDGCDAPHIRPMGSFLRGKPATSVRFGTVRTA